MASSPLLSPSHSSHSQAPKKGQPPPEWPRELASPSWRHHWLSGQRAEPASDAAGAGAWTPAWIWIPQFDLLHQVLVLHVFPMPGNAPGQLLFSLSLCVCVSERETEKERERYISEPQARLRSFLAAKECKIPGFH